MQPQDDGSDKGDNKIQDALDQLDGSEDGGEQALGDHNGVRIWFPFIYISFYNIFPFLHIFTPYEIPEILRNTLKICLK